MGLNWVEDIVSHLYKLKGYMVIENEDLPMPRTEYRKIQGHSDIDIIAIKDTELLHIECQSWWGPSPEEEKRQLRRLYELFKLAPQAISQKYAFLDKDKYSTRNIFVTSGKPKKNKGNGPWDRLQNFCNENKIELVEINSIIYELIEELRRKYPKPERVGRERGIARFLIHLIHNGFLE